MNSLVPLPIRIKLPRKPAASQQAVIKEIIFFGTGTSGCVPSVPCLTKSPPECAVCLDAITPSSKNFRNNTSMLVRFHSPSHEPHRLTNILIDCGKTFYYQAITHCFAYGIRHLDGVLLTHPHADAMFGLDDLRQWTLGAAIQESVDIYLNKPTMAFVQHVFPYLVNTSMASGGGDVSAVKFHLFDGEVRGGLYDEFNLHGLTIQPFEVEHGAFKGEPFMSLGFSFNHSQIVYVSDVSRIPSAVEEVFKNAQVLVIDALHEKEHPSHFSIDQTLAALAKYRPSLGLLTGFSHRVNHNESQKKIDETLKQSTNWELQADSTNVKLAWDGLCLRFD
jgi:phosphoribosyl 1,2-cyclic phosphodiesterase